MDITWFGHSCFRISERGRLTIVTDPFSEALGLPVPRVKGDVVTISHQMPGHNAVEVVKGHTYLLDGPGEYEIGGVFITGLALHDASTGRLNVAYLLDYDHLTVLHLGDLGHVPDQSTMEALGEVNVVLVPVGGGNALRAAQAAEVIALLEPNYVVPMHFALPGLALELDPVDKFLKAMGVGKFAEEDVLKVAAGSLPDQPQVVLLRPQVLAQPAG
ncbi:MAG: MBL fold metallo-hydrolase [Chloroflexi bacterium]|nr:MBL fold metallo-hydrolase [Chloroflexota bacterium]